MGRVVGREGIGDMLREIERKDRRFRMAQGIFMCLLGVGILAVLFVQYQAISEFRDQSAERAKGIMKLEQHNDAQLARQTRYIQCLAQFFATKDRATRVLTDLDKCSISQNGQPVAGVDLNPTAITQLFNVSKPASTAPAQSQSQPVDKTPAPVQPQPVGVDTPVGRIDACLPFTSVCIRQ